MSNVIAGIDVGGTTTTIGLVDVDGKVLSSKVISTVEYGEKEASEFFKDICEIIIGVCTKRGLQLKACGIGAPNGNLGKGTIEYAPNLPWKGIVQVTDFFEEYLNVPTKLTNDANAAALGEMIFGCAKDFKDFIMITLGTGVGSGIVANGSLVYGHDGFAAEIGHSIVYPNGRLCNCGRKGCLEEYVAIRGIKQTAFEFLEENRFKTKFSLENKKEINPKTLAEAAKEGDELGIATYKKTGEILGFKLADAAVYTNPEAFVFFGGIAQAGDLILDPIKRSFEENALQIYKGKIKMIFSTLPSNHAAILGSAGLVAEHFDS